MRSVGQSRESPGAVRWGDTVAKRVGPGLGSSPHATLTSCHASAKWELKEYPPPRIDTTKCLALTVAYSQCSIHADSVVGVPAGRSR